MSKRQRVEWIITVEGATQNNSQLATGRRVALKMVRLLRGSSVTYRSIRRAVAGSRCYFALRTGARVMEILLPAEK
jgi:hypothetical protein